MAITGGDFAGPGLLKFSQGALVLGGTLRAEGCFEEAQNIGVLLDGTIPEIRNPLSGVIVARRIGRIVFDGTKPAAVLIFAESVEEGASHAEPIDPRIFPSTPLEPDQAIRKLREISASRASV
jgi:hypothetical protein